MPLVITCGPLRVTSNAVLTIPTAPDTNPPTIGESHPVGGPPSVKVHHTVEKLHKAEKSAPPSPSNDTGLRENWFSTAIWVTVAAILMPRIVPKL